jgi:predicted RNase H-like HicB family nuclease
MAAVTAYRVIVTREDGQWLAEVPELEGTHSYASSLTALDRAVREALVLGADLPDEAMADLEIAYSYAIEDELVAEANHLRAEREELARREEALKARTQQLAIELTKRGFSARDAGPLLGISHQRISQVRASA